MARFRVRVALDPLARYTAPRMPAANRQLSAFVRFSWGVLAFNLLVILWGAFVRASGSGAGCGSHWPDCNGSIVPRAESVETAIELTHRATSGLALIAVVVQLVWAFRVLPRGHVARRAASASMILMLTEAAIGAGIVLLELVGQNASAARAGWIALHLVNTFLLVGSLTLTPHLASREPVLDASRDDETSRGPRLDAGGGIGWLFGIGAVAMLVTGVAGAITALGDTLFPAASLAAGMAADASPTAHFLVRLRVIHPLIATLAFVYLLMASGLCAMLRPSPEVRRASIVLVVAMLVQMGIGLANIALLAPIWMQLVHLLMADAVWIALVLLGAIALATPRAREARAAAAGVTRPA